MRSLTHNGETIPKTFGLQQVDLGNYTILAIGLQSSRVIGGSFIDIPVQARTRVWGKGRSQKAIIDINLRHQCLEGHCYLK